MPRRYTVNDTQPNRYDVTPDQLQDGTGGRVFGGKTVKPGFAFIRQQVLLKAKGAHDSLFTSGMSGACVCLVYVYGLGEACRGASLAHLNCGSMTDCSAPMATAREVGATGIDADDVHVVIAISYNDEIDTIVRAMLSDGVRDDHIVIYDRCRAKSESFVVQSTGVVGEPGYQPVVKLDIESDSDTAPMLRTANKKRCCCFITTATCVSLGLPDDCEELTKMRWFRDQILARDPGGQHDIETYYQRSPAIVDAINLRADAESIYRALYAEAIRPAIADIDRGDHAKAYSRYRETVEELERRFGLAPAG